MGFSDPYISTPVEVEQDTHDDLNVNANLQVGDADVGNANPVPVSDAGGTLSVDDGGSTISIDDGGSSITVDGTVTTSVPTDFEGAPVTVGTTAVELTFSGTTSTVYVQSDPDNSGAVWIGKSNVTNAGANAMSQLSPGQAVAIELDDASAAVYAVSDTAAQNVFKWATV